MRAPRLTPELGLGLPIVHRGLTRRLWPVCTYPHGIAGVTLCVWIVRASYRYALAMDRSELIRRAASTVPAVVVGAARGALGIVRDLGREGVPVLTMDSSPGAPALASRYSATALYPDPGVSEEDFIRALERVGETLPQRAVLLPTYEDLVDAVSRHKQRLERLYHIPVPPWDRMVRLADKEQQLALAREADVDVPSSAVVHGPDDLAAAGEAVPFPAVLKPSRPHAMLLQSGLKAVGIPRREDLRSTYARFAGVGPLVLQEVVPGRNEDIAIAAGYCDVHGRPLATFTGRKLRQHPRQFGVTRLAESRWHEEVEDLSLRFLRAVGYHGIYDLEFMLDPRDGRYKFIEINARQPLWGPLATAAGLNLPLIAYKDLTGRPPAVPRQRDGVRWSNMWQDGPDSFAEWRRGELSLGEWLSPLAGVRADAWLSVRDPMPILRAFGRRARERVPV